jgi:hypothetical protein
MPSSPPLQIRLLPPNHPASSCKGKQKQSPGHPLHPDLPASNPGVSCHQPQTPRHHQPEQWSAARGRWTGIGRVHSDGLKEYGSRPAFGKLLQEASWGTLQAQRKIGNHVAQTRVFSNVFALIDPLDACQFKRLPTYSEGFSILICYRQASSDSPM